MTLGNKEGVDFQVSQCIPRDADARCVCSFTRVLLAQSPRRLCYTYRSTCIEPYQAYDSFPKLQLQKLFVAASSHFTYVLQENHQSVVDRCNVCEELCPCAVKGNFIREQSRFYINRAVLLSVNFGCFALSRCQRYHFNAVRKAIEVS